MKLILICIGAISVSLLVGFVIGAVLPEPINVILSFILCWCFGWYVVAPIIIEELNW